jgi:hypothetical protein
MQRISVNVKSLKAKLLELEKDGMELAELHFVPNQVDGGDMNPAFLHLDGISKSGVYKDYESIDEYSIVQYLMLHLAS